MAFVGSEATTVAISVAELEDTDIAQIEIFVMTAKLFRTLLLFWD